MAAPQFTVATPGNLLAASSIAASADRAVPLPITSSGVFENQVTCYSQLGAAIAATTGIRFEVFSYYGTTTTTTAVTAGVSTTVTVNSPTGILKGARLGIHDTVGTITRGEILEITNVAGSVLTFSGFSDYSYSIGATIYLLETMPSIVVTPGPNSGNFVADKVYAKTLFIPTGRWFLRTVNLDAANAHTVELSIATIDSVS